MKRIVVIVGHYGSGKTEIAVNMAVNLKKEFEKVAILDMDIANPYFRSRERQEFLENLGIAVHHNSFGYDITEDLPAISAALRTPLENVDYRTVVDVGGDDSGARVLNQFRKYFLSDDSEMLCVLNANRPETASEEGMLEHIGRIEAETGIKIAGLINNTHLLMETEAAHIIEGYELCSKVSKTTGIPIVINTCREDLMPELEELVKARGFTDFPIYPLRLYMRPSWLDR